MNDHSAAPTAPLDIEASSASPATSVPAVGPHPAAYMILIVPFGATSAFVTVALAFLATKVGLTVEDGAALVAVSMAPNMLKVLWAPLGDKTLTRKRWYVLACVCSAGSLAAMASVPLGPATLGLMKTLVLVSSVSATFVGFAVEGMMAHLTPPSDRGRASGFMQAGNLGSSLIGGLSLALVTNLPHPWMAGAILAALMLACCVPLLWLPDVPADNKGGIFASIWHMIVDLFWTIVSRKGFLCAVLCFVPIGTGAASSLLAQADIAKHWGATDTHVAWVQGAIGALFSMAGSFLGGWLCSRFFNARVGYALFGAFMALVTAAMAVSPANVVTYVIYSLLYAFAAGLCYAAFSAFVLDAIGTEHAATKYNGFASLSNTPIWYMGLVLARADTKWSHAGMLWTESLFGILGIALFAIVGLLLRANAKEAQPSVQAA